MEPYTLVMALRPLAPSILAIALGGIFVVVAVESIFPKTGIPDATDRPEFEEECTGEAIYVAYPYEGGMLDPWECKVQCDDKKQRHIVYTNGVATPCEKLPGCLDYGEDYGITCKTKEPLKSTTKK